MSETPPNQSTKPNPHLGWISYLPSPMIPYAELARINVLLVIPLVTFPTALGILYARILLSSNSQSLSPSFPQPTASLILSTYLLRCAGCAWNDIIDQDFDRQNIRCRGRPVARGAVSTFSATVFTFFLFLATYLVLASGNDISSRCVGYAAGVGTLTMTYPFWKRITNYPQIALGGVFAGVFCCAAQGILDTGATDGDSSSAVEVGLFSEKYYISTIGLGGTIILFFVFFDVIYAAQDIEDDVRSGVKGMAVLYRNWIPQLLWVVTGLIAVCLVGTGWNAGFGLVYYSLVVGGVGGLLGMKIVSLGREDGGSSGWWFPLAILCLVGAFAVALWEKPRNFSQDWI